MEREASNKQRPFGTMATCGTGGGNGTGKIAKFRVAGCPGNQTMENKGGGTGDGPFSPLRGKIARRREKKEDGKKVVQRVLNKKGLRNGI